MKHSEMFALRMYLLSFPENDTFDQVLEKLELNHPDIIIWDPFKTTSIAELLDLIFESAVSVESQFFPLHDLISILDKETIRVMFTNTVGRPPFNDELSKVCTALDNDIMFSLQEKLVDALKLLNIKINKNNK